jgi:hypothetical protein
MTALPGDEQNSMEFWIVEGAATRAAALRDLQNSLGHALLRLNSTGVHTCLFTCIGVAWGVCVWAHTLRI